MTDPQSPLTDQPDARAPDEGLRAALERAGFEPPENICASCNHPGGDHDLGNWCLVCPRTEAAPTFTARDQAGWCYFSSMNERERWVYGMKMLGGDRRIEALRERIHPTMDGYCPACGGGCLIGFADSGPSLETKA